MISCLSNKNKWFNVNCNKVLGVILKETTSSIRSWFVRTSSIEEELFSFVVCFEKDKTIKLRLIIK